MSNTVADVLRTRLADDPGGEMIKCGGEWLTPCDVEQASAAVAAGLHELGIRKGDRVMIMLPNRQEVIEVFFACARMGAVQVPVNIFLKGDFLRYQLLDSQCRVAIVDRAAFQLVAPLLDSTSIEQVVLLDSADESDSTTTVRVTPYSDLRDAAGEAPAVEVSGEDLVSILYTSGTTGPSKGCMLSNAYYTVSAQMLLEREWVTVGDRVFTPFQLFHGSAHSVLMQAIVARRGSVCFEPSFSASSLIRRAGEESATMLWLLPPMAMAALAAQAAQGAAEPLISLRLTVCPGLSLPAQLEFERRFGGHVGAEMYGQTECLGVTLGSPTGERRPGTAGRPGPHLEVRVVDDEDRDVPAGEIGEIVVRPLIPHSIYSGYWSNAQATLTAWRNLWHHTGDLVVVDGDGVFSFVDRKKDSLRRRGENVSSFELEASISQLEKVDQVAVSAVSSALGEDDIKASIVLKPGRTTTPAEIFEFFKARLPYFAIPRYVDIRPSMPLTEATGRVQKYVLRKEGVSDSMWDFEALGLSIDRSQRR